VTGAVEPRDVPAASANDCGNDFQNDLPIGSAALEQVRRPAEWVAALDFGCNQSVFVNVSPCVGATVQEPPTVATRRWSSSPLAPGISSLALEEAPVDGIVAACGAFRTERIRRGRGSNPGAARPAREVRRGALRACVFPAKAVPSRGRQVAAERDPATCPRSDQRVGSVEQPHGCSRRALRVGAPQGPKDFGERSDAEVYGATPSSAAKETATLPKVLWGGGRSRGRRSPSGESPKASRGAATKSVDPSISVEGGEA
jgi:hypothetical protein